MVCLCPEHCKQTNKSKQMFLKLVSSMFLRWGRRGFAACSNPLLLWTWTLRAWLWPLPRFFSQTFGWSLSLSLSVVHWCNFLLRNKNLKSCSHSLAIQKQIELWPKCFVSRVICFIRICVSLRNSTLSYINNLKTILRNLILIIHSFAI